MQYFYLCGSCKNVMCSECHDKEEKIAVGKPEKKSKNQRSLLAASQTTLLAVLAAAAE